MTLDSGAVEFTNVGGCRSFVYILYPDKKIDNFCLNPREIKTMDLTPGDTTVYHGSEDLRQLLAQVLLTASGRATQTTFLKKLSSAKLVRVDFGQKPLRSPVFR